MPTRTLRLRIRAGVANRASSWCPSTGTTTGCPTTSGTNWPGANTINRKPVTASKSLIPVRRRIRCPRRTTTAPSRTRLTSFGKPETAKNAYHNQDYYPAWIAEDRLQFSGTRLADNAVDESGGKGSYFVLYAYDWGYVDNHPNSEEDKISFDIGWAVDSLGNPVHLPGVDFIRVYTGVNQQCGWLGETSTELSRAEDLHVEDQTHYLPNP